MAPPTLSIFFLSSLFLLSSAQRPPKPTSFSFPIGKDGPTNQYYTAVRIGSNATAVNVVVDLGGKFLWFNSLDYFNAASSYRPIRCGTPQCRIANGVGCVFCFLSPPVPGCTNNTCSDYAHNPFSGTLGYSGLGQDALRLGDQYRVNNFPFQFSDPVLLEGLATPTAGLIGLGRTRISLPAQLSSEFNIPHKFALCISSSGNLIVGETPYAKPFPDISRSLSTTNLIKNPVSTWPTEQIGNFSVEYFIDVRSIRVGDTALVFNKSLLSIDAETGDGGTILRTVRAYTSLHPSIYAPLIDEFAKAAAARNITRVAPVAPFGACFDSATIGRANGGADVPTIDLVLQRGSVYWRFYGSNSMVEVGGGVICLAFVERMPNLGGPSSSVAVGGYQMENYLLEFDVAAARLRFSESLLVRDTSCSQFRAA